MKQTLSYLKYTKKEAILGPIFKMIEVIFELIVPLIVSSIIDKGINGNDKNYIIYNVILMVLMALGGLVAAVTAQYFSAKAAVRLSTNLRHDLFNKVESLHYEELDKVGKATLVNRLTNDVNQIQSGVNMTLRLLLRSPVVVFGAIIVAFTISTQSGLIFLATVPALFLIILAILCASIPLYNTVQTRLDKVVLRARENIDGVRLIRSFNQEDSEIKKFNEESEHLTKGQLVVSKVSSLTNPLTYVLINLFVILLIYTGAIKVNAGILSQGNIVALYSLASQILVEMIKFANLIILLSKSIASSKRVETILNMKSTLKQEEKVESDNDYLFEVNNISLHYANAQRALNNISFKVKEGETVGIIGGTGSGKTSLINVLMHFYDIDEGKIFYKGQNLNSYPLDVLNKEFSLVPQKAMLFRGTIKDNLLWGKIDASEKEIANALKISQASEVVDNKKNKLDELVEEGGKNFSGGQKQRLCIARALIKDAPVIILDDATSALDYATDAKLRMALKKLKNKTVFIISQRAASLLNCDKILVLDQGTLVGSGTHEDLLNNCDVYKEIYRSQFKEEE